MHCTKVVCIKVIPLQASLENILILASLLKFLWHCLSFWTIKLYEITVAKYQLTLYIKEKQKQTNTPLWNMKQFGSSNHLICFSSLAYRGRTPKRAFLVGSKENISVLFFTISWKVDFNQQFKTRSIAKVNRLYTYIYICGVPVSYILDINGVWVSVS